MTRVFRSSSPAGAGDNPSAPIFPMPREKDIFRIVANREQRRLVQMEIGMLPDRPYRITIHPSKPSKTMRQLGYYFSTHVEVFRRWLTEQWGENVTVQQAHLALKEKCLRKSIVNEKTGETIEYTGSVADLDVPEMSDYMEDCANFIAEFTGIPVPEPRGPSFPANAPSWSRSVAGAATGAE